MNLWVDSNGVTVFDNQQYRDASGNLWTKESNKATIPGLSVVVQVDKPTDPSLIITGFTVQTIGGVKTQVWTTAPKPAPSSDEITQIIIASTNALLLQRATKLTAAGRTADAMKILLQLQQGVSS